MLNKLSREVLIELIYQFLLNPKIKFPEEIVNLVEISLNKEDNKFKDSSKLDLDSLNLLLNQFNTDLVFQLEIKLQEFLKDYTKTPSLIKSVLIAFIIEKEKLKIENLKTLLNKYIKYCNKYCFVEEANLVHATLSKYVSQK